MRVSTLILKGAKIGSTEDKIFIKKNGVSMTLNTRKVQNKSMMFYLKAKRYTLELQEALTNMPENKIGTRDKKRRMP